MTDTTKLAKSIIASVFLMTASAAANAQTEQTVPLSTYVNIMTQHTTALNSQDVHFGAMQSVANTAHQFLLDDQPQFAPTINVIDIVQNTIASDLKAFKDTADEAE